MPSIFELVGECVIIFIPFNLTLLLFWRVGLWELTIYSWKDPVNSIRVLLEVSYAKWFPSTTPTLYAWMDPFNDKVFPEGSSNSVRPITSSKNLSNVYLSPYSLFIGFNGVSEVKD